ncbi:MAG: MarR family transcriptional regulator [Planctomycetes bacterium]|nr:MarR family transcriptional regulator [Planctomycetota bacterium]
MAENGLERDVRRVAALFPQIFKQLTAVESRKTAPPEITIAQVRALRILGENDGRTMGELSDAAAITMPTATATVDKLVEAGLASRENDPSDRRVVRVKLTDKGRQFVEEHNRRRLEYVGRALRRLPTTDRAELVKAFETINSILAKLGKSPADG